MLQEDQLNLFADVLYQRVVSVNDEYLKIIGERYKEIGTISGTNQHRLRMALKWQVSDVNKIEKLLATAMNKNVEDVQTILETIAKDNLEFSEQYYEAKSVEFVPYAKNKELQDLVEGMVKTAVLDIDNLAKTTSISTIYKSAINDAVVKANLSLENYQTAIKSVIREVAEKGLNYVEYESGYKRRLDSSVRQNILYSMKQANLKSSELVGKQFGNDGWEISAHSNPRKSHLSMQGNQYTIKEFESQGIQDKLNDFNCMHYKFAILVGMAEPVYTKKQLEDMRKSDTEKIQYNGKQLTRYEGTQIMRKMETEVRRNKDALTVARKANNKDLVNELTSRNRKIQSEYKNVAKTFGLAERGERMQIVRVGNVAKNQTAITPIASNNITFTKAKTLKDSTDFLEKDLNLRLKDYKDVNLDFSNEIGNAITKAYNEFKDFGKDNYLKGIKLTNTKTGYYAAYMQKDREILIPKITAKSANALDEMDKMSKLQKKYLFWSNDNTMTAVYHELGHSIENYYIETKPQIKQKLDDYYNEIKKKSNIKRWSQNAKWEEREKAGVYLSYYGFMNRSEFVAESIAEYMNGNPREVSKRIVEILRSE